MKKLIAIIVIGITIVSCSPDTYITNNIEIVNQYSKISKDTIGLGITFPPIKNDSLQP